MKHLFNGVAIAAALAIAGPVWAQSPTGGNAVGTPGPNPGGPGLTPYSGGAAPSPPASTSAPPASTSATPASTSATPPMHPHYAAHHMHAMHHFHKAMAHKAALAGDTTAALNRQELARINSGNFSNPPAAPMPGGPPKP
jgi:hypothetical protein